MKQKLILGMGLLVVLLTTVVMVDAKKWRTQEENSLCVSGDGGFRVTGEGEVFLDAEGTFRVPRGVDVDIEDGFFERIVTRRYVYYAGDGSASIDDFEGVLTMYGGGSGFLRLDGVGSVELRGNKQLLETGC